MTSTSTTLDYDRSLNCEGVAIDRGPGWFRLITPRPTLRSISPATFVIVLALFALLVFVALAALNEPPNQRWHMIVPISEFAFFLLIGLLFVMTRANQRFVFDITRSQFVMTRVDFATSRRRWIFRRDAITGINVSSSPGKVSIHARGQDLIELFISRDQTIVQRVVDALNDAMREDFDHVDRSLPDLLEEPQVRRPAVKYALIATSIAIACAGVVLMVMIRIPPLGCYVIPLAAVPLGLLYGTQKKDYYL